MGRFLVRLHEARALRGLVHEREPALGLLDRCGVDLPELTLRRPESPVEPRAAGVFGEPRRARAEELAARELLVDLQARLQPERAVVHQVGKRGSKD